MSEFGDGKSLLREQAEGQTKENKTQANEQDVLTNCLCGICQDTVKANVCCPECAAAFCYPHLQKWWSENSKACPACRAVVPAIGEFRHNAGLQKKINLTPKQCENGCGVDIPFGEMDSHCREHCRLRKVKCPFDNCSWVGAQRELDVHVYGCPHRTQYRDLGRCSDSVFATGDVIEGNESLQDADGNLRHFIKEYETLAGIAIRYSANLDELRKLNRLPNDNISFLSVIKIPYSEERLRKCREAIPNPEILAALRRRKAIRDFLKRADGAEVHEAVAYLNLKRFDMEAALEKYSRDLRWSRDNEMPSHFAQFAQRLHVRPEKRKQTRKSHKDSSKGDGNDSDDSEDAWDYWDGSDYANAGPSGTKARYSNCHKCIVRDLNFDSGRDHCRNCGHIFCSKCLGEFVNKQVPRSSLGATTETAHKEYVRVCDDCYASTNLAQTSKANGA
eukprot:Clim_evm45s128 gene=Clim_evmTU45s128